MPLGDDGHERGRVGRLAVPDSEREPIGTIGADGLGAGGENPPAAHLSSRAGLRSAARQAALLAPPEAGRGRPRPSMLRRPRPVAAFPAALSSTSRVAPTSLNRATTAPPPCRSATRARSSSRTAQENTVSPPAVATRTRFSRLGPANPVLLSRRPYRLAMGAFNRHRPLAGRLATPRALSAAGVRRTFDGKTYSAS
jgi:hypothetical protein